MKSERSEPILHEPSGATYHIVRSSRRSLAIKVVGDSQFEVRVPFVVSSREIQSYLAEHSSWIVKTLKRVQSLPSVPPLTGVQGSVVQRNLQSYTLEVQQGADTSVELLNDTCIVTVTRKMSDQGVKKIIEEWYGNTILQVATKTMNDISQTLLTQDPTLLKQLLGTSYHKKIQKTLSTVTFSVRTMKNRWGSCYHKSGAIFLNRHLARGTDAMIQSVVIHELCHLWFFYHDKNFYRLLEFLYPQWREAKKDLAIISKNC